MNDIIIILDILEQNNLHVHVIEEDEKLPIHVTAADTHYIMQEDKIVHVGNLMTIEYWVNSIPSLLADGGQIRCRDF